MTQPIGAGAPTPVQGVTGGPGLPQGVASVDGTTGNVQISPPNNTTQFKKGATPQSLQVYEFDGGPTNFARLALNAQTNGPFQIAVEQIPTSPARSLEIRTQSSIFFGGGAANAWQMNMNTGEFSPVTDLAYNIGNATHAVLKLFVNNLQLNASGAANAGPSFFGSTGAPSAATGINGDLYFNVIGGAGTTIWQKRAGAWVGIV